MTISIIIPCYNAEQHIDRCPESVVNQTIGLGMLEIVVINDASTDGTLDKLLDWEKRFPDNIMAVMLVEEYGRRGALEACDLIFTRFDYIPDIMGDMKKIMSRLFPHYREKIMPPTAKRSSCYWHC